MDETNNYGQTTGENTGHIENENNTGVEQSTNESVTTPEQTTVESDGGFQQAQNPEFFRGEQVENDKKGMALASMILGICSIPTALIIAIIGLIVGIVGLILGIVSKNSSEKGKAKTGIILSIIGMVVAVINMIVGVIIFMTALNNLSM